MVRVSALHAGAGSRSKSGSVDGMTVSKGRLDADGAVAEAARTASYVSAPDADGGSAAPDVDEEGHDGVVLGHEPHDGVQAQVDALYHHALATRLSFVQQVSRHTSTRSIALVGADKTHLYAGGYTARHSR